MRCSTPSLTIITSLALLGATSARAEPWSRGYVVDHFQPAFLFGGPIKETPEGRKLAVTEKGSDCPNGLNPRDFLEMLKVPWRSDAETRALLEAQLKAPATDRFQGLGALLAQRGFRPGVNVYYSPFAAPDPGMAEVAGDKAEGFNLDGREDTGGFTNAAGERGVDNAWYRAVGCVAAWRGGVAGGALNQGQADQFRRDGIWVNTVIRISGTQSPQNDSDATVEIAWSPDSAIRDAKGGMAAGYSFRMAVGPRYTRMKARIVDGLLETEVTPALRTSSPAHKPTETGELVFQKGRMRLRMTADGGLSGLVGGYVNWTELYMSQALTGPPAAKDQIASSNLMSEYYALRRNADGIPDPKTGRNTALSTAFEISAVPAYVVEPETPLQAPVHMFPDWLHNRTLFLEAQSSRTIVPFRSIDMLEPNPRNYESVKTANNIGK